MGGITAVVQGVAPTSTVHNCSPGSPVPGDTSPAATRKLRPPAAGVKLAVAAGVGVPAGATPQPDGVALTATPSAALAVPEATLVSPAAGASVPPATMPAGTVT